MSKNKSGTVASKKSKKAAESPQDEAREIVEALVKEATIARDNAYAPYSKYKVGSAILTESGHVFVGCNFENASFGACICAERNAVGAMVVAGESKPIAIAIVTAGKTPGTPCGICRQVLREFAKDMTVVLVGLDGKKENRRVTSLDALLPDAFVFPK